MTTTWTRFCAAAAVCALLLTIWPSTAQAHDEGHADEYIETYDDGYSDVEIGRASCRERV